MIGFIDLILALLVMIWFNILRHRKSKIANLMHFHSILMFMFVFSLHMYSYDYLNVFPAITRDGLRYNLLGSKFAHELENGRISFYTGEPIFTRGFSAQENEGELPSDIYLRGGGKNVAPAYTYGIIGSMYYLFGNVPFTIKIINVILFQLSFLHYNKILGLFKIGEKRNRIFQLLYLFMPTFIVYSSSMMKEAIVLYATMALLADIYLKRSWVNFSYHSVLLLLTRIYNPVIILGAFGVANYKSLLKNKMYLVIGLAGIVALSTVPIIGKYDLMFFLTKFPFAISVGKGNNLWFDGLFDLMGYSLTHPSILLKTLFYGAIDLLFKPQPWFVKIPYYGSYMFPRLAARWLSSFFMWYILWQLFPYVKDILKRSSQFKFTIILTVFESIWLGMHFNMRYKFAYIPVLMILAASAMHYIKLDDQTLKIRKMMFIPTTLFLALFASFFWGSDAITKVGF